MKKILYGILLIAFSWSLQGILALFAGVEVAIIISFSVATLGLWYGVKGFEEKS